MLQGIPMHPGPQHRPQQKVRCPQHGRKALPVGGDMRGLLVVALLESRFPLGDGFAILCAVRFMRLAQKATCPAVLGAPAFMVCHSVRFSSARVRILQLGVLR